jgi:hypothetical protein
MRLPPSEPVAAEGWGARLLALRGDDGQWAGGACFPADFRGDFSAGQPWTSTLPTLTLLRDFGVDPDAEQSRETVVMVRDNCRWEHAGQPFFAGEVEPCINGRTVAIGAYFSVNVDDRHSAGRRAACGRRLELRGRQRVGAFLLPHDDLCARGLAGTRAGDRRFNGDPRGAPAR